MVSVVDGFGKPGSDFKYISGKHLYLVGLTWNMTLMVVLRAELGRDKAEENRPNSLNGHPRTLPRWISMREQHFVVLKLGHVWQHSEPQPDGNSLPAEHPPAISGASFCCRGRARDSVPLQHLSKEQPPSLHPQKRRSWCLCLW